MKVIALVGLAFTVLFLASVLPAVVDARYGPLDRICGVERCTVTVVTGTIALIAGAVLAMAVLTGELA